jgi:hypothetical protein
MATAKKDAFYWRAFVTFYVVLSFLVIAATGVILYIAPPGRVANWSEWTLGGLRKNQWQAVHTVFSFLFVAAASFHLYFNWRVIVAYVKSKLGEGVKRGRELALASGSAVTVLAMTVTALPPFGTIMTLGEEAKNSWSNPATEPPVPHAEMWTLAKYAEATKMPVEQAMANLNEAGMPVGGADTTLSAVAAVYRVTPKEVYQKALGTAKAAPAPVTEGGGYGQRTVQEVAEQLHVPLEHALDRLREAGVKNAAGDANIRTLATSNGKRPFELVQILQAQ